MEADGFVQDLYWSNVTLHYLAPQKGSGWVAEPHKEHCPARKGANPTNPVSFTPYFALLPYFFHPCWTPRWMLLSGGRRVYLLASLA